MDDKRNRELTDFDGRAMTYVQFEDILDQVRKFHRCLQDRLQALQPTDERMKMYVDRLVTEESELDRALDTYDPRTRREHLKNWLKTVPEIDIYGPLEQADLESARTPDDLAGAIIEGNQGLLRFLHHLADEASTETSRDIFQSLESMAVESNKTYQREALSMHDI